MSTKVPSWLGLGCLAVSIWLWALVANAADTVIFSGREKDVMALFAPYTLGGPVTPELKLWNVRVEPERIVVELEGKAKASFRLEHPTRAKNATERSKSFAIVREASATAGAGKRATDLLLERLRANDAGNFWSAPNPNPRTAFESRAPHSAAQRYRGWWLPLLVVILAAGSALWVAAISRRAS